MRKLFVLAVVAGLFVASLAAPASADVPIEFDEMVVFDSVNACTGEAHVVTLEFHIKMHQHKHNTVLVVDSEASTSDGFSGVGHEMLVVNENVEKATANFVVSNPDTDQAYTVKINVLFFELGPPIVENFTISCIRG
ncbi:MAG: hypothetical protein ABFR53_03550 [Actinomycetota bacterium]